MREVMVLYPGHQWKECIKAASDSEYASDSVVTESEIAPSSILCTTYECKNGSPGFNLETVDVDE